MIKRDSFQKLIITAFLMLFPTLSKACPDAADLASVGAEPALADCLLLAQFDIETGRGIVQGSIYGTPETDLALVQAAEEALTRSGVALRGLSGLGSGPVALYISPTGYSLAADGDDTLAAAQPARGAALDGARPCIIAAFPTLALRNINIPFRMSFSIAYSLAIFTGAMCNRGLRGGLKARPNGLPA